MTIIMVGGTRSARGGVEMFCRRAETALAEFGSTNVEALDSNSAHLTPARITPYLKSLFDFVSKICGSKTDGIWVQYVNLPDLVYVFIARMLGKRVVVTPHLGLEWKSQKNKILKHISMLLLGSKTRIAYLSASQIAELSLAHQGDLTEITTFMPQAVLTGVERAMSGDVMRLVHIARLSESKGSLLFLEVCRNLKASGRSFRAEIIGTGDPRFIAKLHEYASDHDLEEVKFRGHVDEAGVVEALLRSDVLLHLSRLDSYPLIVLEGLACGVYPVCLDLAGARNIIERYHGTIVCAQDATRHASEFLIGLDLEDLRDASDEIRPRVVEDHAWKRCAMLAEAAVCSVAPISVPGNDQLPSSARLRSKNETKPGRVG
jgi:glycosyltransferase involved in cell wall biosynthesis